MNQIDDDVKNGFSPVVLIANAGSYNIGQCDDIQELNQICYKYKMWLHLEGVYLSTLILYSIPTAIQVNIILYYFYIIKFDFDSTIN